MCTTQAGGKLSRRATLRYKHARYVLTSQRRRLMPSSSRSWMQVGYLSPPNFIFMTIKSCSNGNANIVASFSKTYSLDWRNCKLYLLYIHSSFGNHTKREVKLIIVHLRFLLVIYRSRNCGAVQIYFENENRRLTKDECKYILLTCFKFCCFSL